MSRETISDVVFELSALHAGELPVTREIPELEWELIRCGFEHSDIALLKTTARFGKALGMVLRLAGFNRLRIALANRLMGRDGN